jgi:hypothetical protein
MIPATEDSRRVVARFADGRLLKGTTHDFAPQKERFHLCVAGNEAERPVEIAVSDLKALFFVKTFEGDSSHVRNNDLEGVKGQGRRVLVTFNDGEVVAGFTVGFSPDKPGFFLIPSDAAGNNLRIFVVRRAVRRFEWVGSLTPAGSVLR